MPFARRAEAFSKSSASGEVFSAFLDGGPAARSAPLPFSPGVLHHLATRLEALGTNRPFQGAEGGLTGASGVSLVAALAASPLGRLGPKTRREPYENGIAPRRSAYSGPMLPSFPRARPRRILWLGGALVLTGASVLVVACREATSVAVPAPAPPPTPIESALPSAAVRPSDAGAELVDLLHTVACTVAVSSKVENPLDFPEHLVDGKMDTAWNGKTGDLQGFIAFRTPRVTRVRRVELTSGFDKTGPKGDLFVKNHRITKVRLSREGKLVKEADLDPLVRGLQGIDLDEEGGDFKLEILATLPGSEKKWRELTVSEFRVLGARNGAPGNPEHIPAMAIGSLDGVPPRQAGRGEAPPGPFASVSELCAAYHKALAPGIDAAFPGDRYPGKIGGPHCKRLEDPAAQKVAATMIGGPFVAAELVRVNDPSLESARLVLKTAKGYSLTRIVLWSHYHNDPGCGHAGISSLEDSMTIKANGHEAFVVRTLQSDAYWIGATDPGGTVESAYACVMDDRGAASCEGPLVTGRSTGWPAGWDAGAGRFPAVVASKVKWDFRKEPTLGPAGDLRLVP